MRQLNWWPRHVREKSTGIDSLFRNLKLHQVWHEILSKILSAIVFVKIFLSKKSYFIVLLTYDNTIDSLNKAFSVLIWAFFHNSSKQNRRKSNIQNPIRPVSWPIFICRNVANTKISRAQIILAPFPADLCHKTRERKNSLFGSKCLNPAIFDNLLLSECHDARYINYGVRRRTEERHNDQVDVKLLREKLGILLRITLQYALMTFRDEASWADLCRCHEKGKRSNFFCRFVTW